MVKKTLIIVTFVCLFLLSACLSKGMFNAEDYMNIVWQWQDYAQKVPAFQGAVPNPENYTITFMDDSTASIKADCNMVVAVYEMDNGSLKITLGPSTMVLCGEASLDQQFLEFLGKVDKIGMSGKTMIMQFPNDGGQMSFGNGGEVP